MLIFENYFLIHRQAFDLLEFDIQELEESLLLMGSEDDSTQLVQRLVIKLLKGCSNTFTKNITEDVSKSNRKIFWKFCLGSFISYFFVNHLLSN